MKLSVTLFKKHCTRLLRELPQHREPILITNHSRVVAKVTPVVQEGNHPAWGALSRYKVEIAEDFDQPLGDTDWEAAG